jgi:hypothetical protein
MKKIIILLVSVLMYSGIKADEGMWMLPLIEKLNIQKVNGLGAVLTAEDIYSDKNVSLKDAVIVFGGGCTGVVVSNQGLIFTNHHCGFGAIQQLSAVGHNYLKNGFAAKTLSDEIPAPGLTVKFLVSIEDVTERIVSQLDEKIAGKERKTKQDSIISEIKKEQDKDSLYLVDVNSFYAGNEFYMFKYEVFKDIRFAYAPPTSIGKFGGDTDNWMWPRHTGDFSVFRVYSSPDGKAAEYSKDNVPYSPKRFAKISNAGYKPGDYAMILGNPGSTSRYLSSWGIDNRIKTGNRARIDIRGAKQAVWKSYMKADEAINIAYASKFAGSSNYWKNSIGMNNALQKLDVVERKKEEERAFQNWVNSSEENSQLYGNVLSDLENSYKILYPYDHAISFLVEAMISGVEMPRIASRIESLSQKDLSNDEFIEKATEFYKDYYQEVDQETFAVMLAEYKKAVNADALPDFYTTIDKKFKGDYTKYAKYIYSKSVFSNSEKFLKLAKKGKINYKKDLALQFSNEVRETLSGFRTDDYKSAREKIADAERLYESGLKKMAEEKGVARYPNANFTMRLTYGSVSGYKPADATHYDYYSTTQGILEKEIPNDYEFDVPAELKKAIVEEDFGKYIDKQTGKMHVAFLSNNDITGGNSGSPVFNANGELIGLAFDGNWEAMSGDIVFEPELQRTISVDIRYVLWIMEKVGGAQRLIDELTIVD